LTREQKSEFEWRIATMTTSELIQELITVRMSGAAIDEAEKSALIREKIDRRLDGQD
jgi:hypothetical protein